MPEVYDFFLDESPEYFDYDTDCQGLGYSSICSTVQLAQVPAPPHPTLFTFESFAEAVALVHPLPTAVTSVPVSPSLSYVSLSDITSTLSLPTILSLPESWASRSPSPIDYENIAGWAEEAEESEPLAAPVDTPPVLIEFPQVPEVPVGTFIFENPVLVAEPAPVPPVAKALVEPPIIRGLI